MAAPRLLDHTGRPFPKPAPAPRRVRARYDAAQTSDENRRHWSNADSLGAKSANDPGVRQKLRDRSRYELANNSYAKGMALTLANDLIGTGPRLQLQTPDREVNRLVEHAFGQWAKEVRLAEKLRTLKLAKTGDGEGFVLLVNNPTLTNPVQLDLQLVEADQVADPALVPSLKPNEWDGIRYDTAGNPVAYHVLREHPGDTLRFFNFEGDWVPARFVIHWFRCDRPGQIRGVPEITPALPLFAQLRRWTLACLASAETAANFAGVLYNEAGAEEDDQPTPFSAQEIERGMLAAMPMGWKLEQLRAEQPRTTHEMFARVILAESARCLHMPYIIASGDYKGANFSSGRQAHQVYHRSIFVERSECDCVVLRRVYYAWLAEAVKVPGLLPAGLTLADLVLAYRWYWDGFTHVDPSKEAGANREMLASRQTTLAAIYAEKGEDWEDALRQRAKEVALVQELQLPPTIEEDPGQAWQQDTAPGSDVFEETETEPEEESDEEDDDLPAAARFRAN